jgi:hypothetical protein
VPLGFSPERKVGGTKDAMASGFSVGSALRVDLGTLESGVGAPEGDSSNERSDEPRENDSFGHSTTPSPRCYGGKDRSLASGAGTPYLRPGNDNLCDSNEPTNFEFFGARDRVQSASLSDSATSLLRGAFESEVEWMSEAKT